MNEPAGGIAFAFVKAVAIEPKAPASVIFDPVVISCLVMVSAGLMPPFRGDAFRPVGPRETVEEIALPAMGGIRLVPGASGVERLANLSDVERASMIASFEALHRDADYIIFDTGAGISKNTTAFLAAADDVIVVTMPEPTAVVDAYAVIKMLSKEEDHGDLFILLNQCSGREEAERFANGISVTANKLLNCYVDKLGYIVTDPRVGNAVRQRRPFVLAFPGCPASLCLRSIAQRVALQTGRSQPAERPSFIRRLFSAFSRA